MSGEQLVPYGGSTELLGDLSMARTPDEIVSEAQRAAAKLKAIVEAKPNKVIMNNEQYLEFEDWALLGRFYGCTARVAEGSTRFVEYGGVVGFESTGEVYDTRTGQVISRADAMCLSDEDRWNTRPRYEWRENQKVQIGEERVPLFQLRSMAQTRACAKALRFVFSPVVVLAGYRPTPAEEMDQATGQPREGGQPPIAQPRSTTQPTGEITTDAVHITDACVAKSGTNKRGEWHLYRLTTDGGVQFSTFDRKHYETAAFAKQEKAAVHITYKVGARGSNELLGITPAVTGELFPEDGEKAEPGANG